jgi:hypothetical protein
MHQLSPSNSNLVEACADTSANKIRVVDMPDPEDVFSLTIGGADTSHSFVHAPNIRNHDGSMIQPQEYERKLTDGDVVMINVFLKM